MRQQINFGIVGPGRIAKRLAAALTLIRNAQLWSVCSRSLDRAQHFAEEFQAQSEEKGYNNFQSFLKDPDLDVVIVATPDDQHVEYICAAIEMGKHVFIEKPLCTSLADIESIKQSKSRHQVTVGVGYHFRWHTGLRAIAKKIHDEDFGKIHLLNLRLAHQFFDENNWRCNKDTSKWCSLSVFGTHGLDLAMWFLNKRCGKIISVTGLQANTRFHATDESAAFSVLFETGAIAQIYCSVLFNMPLALEVYSDKHQITASHLTATPAEQMILINGKTLNIKHATNHYVDELEDFINVIKEKRDPEVSLDCAMNNVKYLLQI